MFVSRILPLPLLLLRTHFCTTIERSRGTPKGGEMSKRITLLLCEGHIKSSKKNRRLRNIVHDQTSFCWFLRKPTCDRALNFSISTPYDSKSLWQNETIVQPSWLYIVQPCPKNSFMRFSTWFFLKCRACSEKVKPGHTKCFTARKRV